MKILRHWKVVLVLMLMFVAGVITGAVLSTMRFKHAFERALMVETWTGHNMQIMQRDLGLTPKQQPEVRAILDETWQQIGANFSRAVSASGTNLVASWRRIDEQLTPEQRVMFQKECQVFRDRVKKILKIELPPQTGKAATT